MSLPAATMSSSPVNSDNDSDSSDNGFMAKWNRLDDGKQELTPDIINEGFAEYCDPRGYSARDLLSAIWDRDGIRDRLELQKFADYDSEFRAYAAFFYNVVKYTFDCKRGWSYHFPIDHDLPYIHKHLTLPERLKKFDELEVPAMISGFVKEAVESGDSSELKTLFQYCVSRKCESEDHFDDDMHDCDCKAAEGVKALFKAQSYKVEV